jgi:YHS domain-containing protein
MIEKRTIHPSEDPVCAMRVDLAKARATGLVLTHGDVDYPFCSDGCLIEFRDDPAWFLDPAYTPTTM